MSVADLAVGLASVVEALRQGKVGTFKFEQSDDMLEISFQATADQVTITHNLIPGRRWVCSRALLQTAMRNFVTTFAEEAARRVADVFNWRDMEVLRGFSVDHINH